MRGDTSPHTHEGKITDLINESFNLSVYIQKMLLLLRDLNIQLSICKQIYDLIPNGKKFTFRGKKIINMEN